MNFLGLGALANIGGAIGAGMVLPAQGKVDIPAMGNVDGLMPNIPNVQIPSFQSVSFPSMNFTVPPPNFGTQVGSVVTTGTGTTPPTPQPTNPNPGGPNLDPNFPDFGGIPGPYPQWPNFPGYGDPNPFPGYGNPNPFPGYGNPPWQNCNPFFAAQMNGWCGSFYGTFCGIFG